MDEPAIPRLALALAEARGRLGVSQCALAEIIGVSQVAVSGWERGLVTPRADRLADIARGYALPVGRLRTLWMAGESEAT